MLANLAIAALSAAMLLYWFRYSCLLILRSRHEARAAGEVARANGLESLLAPNWLSSSEPDVLDALHRSLERDRTMLVYLLDHSFGPVLPRVERWIIMFDFAVMSGLYRLLHRVSAASARLALREMVQIIAVLAGAIGRRNPAPAR